MLEYLDERSPRGARNVKQAIKRTLDMIGERPHGRPTGHGAVRSAPVSRYPYMIFWTVEADEVWLVHIRHGARKPWRL